MSDGHLYSFTTIDPEVAQDSESSSTSPSKPLYPAITQAELDEFSEQPSGSKRKDPPAYSLTPTKEPDTKKNRTEEEVEKGSKNDIMKAFSSVLDLKLQGITASNATLLKNLEILKSENNELRTAIDEIGNQRLGRKSATHHTFIEKATQNDFGTEGGKTVLSLSQNKAQVENVLDAAMEKATNATIKKALGEQLMNYNSGNSPISQEIASYLYSTENIKLVQ